MAELQKRDAERALKSEEERRKSNLVDKRGTLDGALKQLSIREKRKKDGKKMFNMEHKLKFKVKADTDIIARVATQIMNADNYSNLKKK